jgi:hypothetical protein
MRFMRTGESNSFEMASSGAVWPLGLGWGGGTHPNPRITYLPCSSTTHMVKEAHVGVASHDE